MLRLLSLLLLLLLPVSAAAQSSVRNPHTRLELIAESASVAPGGKAALALVLTPEPGWHTYWKNPGGAGVEVQAKWTLPATATVSGLRYPVPKTFLVSGIMNYVFEGETALLADLGFAGGMAAGTKLPVRLHVDYLVCDDTICVPEAADLALDLVAGDGAPGPSAARFDRARQALPRPVDWPARFSRDGDRFRLAVPLAMPAEVRGAYFFPETDGVLDYDAPQDVRIDGKTLIVDTLAGYDDALTRVAGVLKLDMADGTHFGAAITAARGDVALAGKSLTEAGKPRGGIASALTAFGFAVLGGLILNIMPCVFPILGLKALSLARGGTSEAHARREALAYTAGVVLTSVALGGAILGLRAAGASVGWAFQLQDPRVIVVLLLLLSAITLNLAGVFEIAAPRVGGDVLAAKKGSVGAFWTGVLAAIVATPCTGPFMGVALGAAILLPSLIGLIIFAGLGIGLALPFLAIGFVPALRSRLPKPGPWLERFRHLMAIPMFVTALALAWVLWRQSGTTGLLLGVGGAVLLAAALAWVGWRQRGGRSARLPVAISLASLLTIAWIPMHARDAMPVKTVATLPNTEPFSEARLAALVAEGRPAFVYFTADWCITCKVNENGAMSSAAVARAFADADVAVLVGDWTNADPAITRFLESQGRAGVPLYLFYGRDGEAKVLPQILGSDELAALAKAA